MKKRAERCDPFATISEKEVLWQETSEASKEVRGDVKGKASDRVKRESFVGTTAEDVKKSWADYRSRKKQKSLKNKVGE